MNPRAAALIVIPTFNEEGNLPSVLGAIRSACPGHDALVVDDGSVDRSADIARDFGATVLSHPKNLGYGAALVSGYRHALTHGYETVVQLDADGQHDPCQVGILLTELAKGESDIVVGSRMISGGGHQTSLPRRIGIHLFARLGTWLTGRSITDPTSGFAAMNRRAVAFLEQNTPHDFPDVNVLVALHRAGLRATEVPVTMAPRRSGKSQMRGVVPFIYVPRMLYYLHQIYRAPETSDPTSRRR